MQQQLREGHIGDLSDHRQLEDLDDVSLHPREGRLGVGPAAAGVDEHQSAYLAWVALGEPERDRPAVGVADENRPQDMELVQQRVASFPVAG